MTVFITLVIIIIVVAYVAYPFFGKSTALSAQIVKRPSGRSTVNKTRKAGRKPGDINSEIERRITEIRKKENAVCPECGASYRKGSSFCSQCGADLSAAKDEN